MGIFNFLFHLKEIYQGYPTTEYNLIHKGYPKTQYDLISFAYLYGWDYKVSEEDGRGYLFSKEAIPDSIYKYYLDTNELFYFNKSTKQQIKLPIKRVMTVPQKAFLIALLSEDF